MEQHFQVRPGIDLMPACPILWHRLLRAASLHHAPTFFKSSPGQFPAFLAGWKEDVEVTGNGRKGDGFLGTRGGHGFWVSLDAIHRCALCRRRPTELPAIVVATLAAADGVTGLWSDGLQGRIVRFPSHANL